MGNLWFLLTLMLDIVPFMILSVCILREKLPGTLVGALSKMIVVFMCYYLPIYFTYTRGMYGAKLMVGLRIGGIVLAILLLYGIFHNYLIQFTYKCFFALPYMLVVLQISAFCMNFINGEGMPDFMLISCLRILFYVILGYPYYLIEKNLLLANLDVEDKRVWGLFAISQFTLNVAMLTSIKTDYATEGIDVKSFITQLIMLFASMSVTLFLFYGFKLAKNVELIKEQKRRDELLLELNTRQYQAIQENIEQMRHLRHDIKHHIRVLEQLMNEQKYDTVEEYLREYQDAIPEGTKIKFCENMSINALLEYYYSDAKQKEIDVSFDAAQLADCGIDDIDLNILLGNAIENAIEACMNVESGKRSVKLCAKIMAGQIFITVDNHFDGIVKNSKGGFLSKKRNFKKTGYGNASMNAIAEKYSGEIKREINGNNYQVSIVLKKL